MSKSSTFGAGLCPQVSAGGSLSNTLIGLSRLGQADNCLRGSGGFQVALAAAVGSDTLGSFFAAQSAKAGVAILEESLTDSCTGVHASVAALYYSFVDADQHTE